MKKVLLLLVAAPLCMVGCAAPKLINDNNGKLVYQYPMPQFEKTFAAANAKCMDYGKRADMQGQPNCVPLGFDMPPTCTASFVCN